MPMVDLRLQIQWLVGIVSAAHEVLLTVGTLCDAEDSAIHVLDPAQSTFLLVKDQIVVATSSMCRRNPRSWC
jgi:hypothetical protein